MIYDRVYAKPPLYMRLLTFLLPALAIFFALPTLAADVRPFGSNGVIIEGLLIEGDHAKLVSLLNRSGASIDRVSIYSNGGSVFEAIKIGTLIRDLRLRTIAPSGYGSRGNVCHGIASQKNCTCLSACVLVFAGGIHYYGNVLGMHRSYVGHDFPKSVRGDPGINASEQLMYTVSDYLKTMGFPQQFIDTMNDTHSHNMTLLKTGDINRYLSGYAPQFGEKLVEKCRGRGNTSQMHDQLERKRKSTGLTAAEQQQYAALRTTSSRSFSQCQQTAEKNLREEAFDRMMKNTKKNVSQRPRV